MNSSSSEYNGNGSRDTTTNGAVATVDIIGGESSGSEDIPPESIEAAAL